MQNRKIAEKLLKNGIDIIALALSFCGSAFLAKQHAGIGSGFVALTGWEILFLLFLCLAWRIGARLFGLYDEFRVKAVIDELTALGENVLLQVFLAMAVLFAIKSQTFSRFFILVYCLLSLTLLLLARLLVNGLRAWQHKNGRNQSRILVIGAGEVACNFFSTVSANAYLGYRVIGFVSEQPPPGLASLHLGAIEQLAQLLQQEKPDEVIIALPNAASGKIGQVIAICENYPAQIRIIPDYFEFMGPRFGISRFASFPLISMRSNPLEKMHWRLLKKIFDLTLTLLLFILVFSWLWPLIILLIKRSSPGPVFFRQERWGEKNKPIICYKFRSMVQESCAVDEDGRYQPTKRDDRRVTRIGRFLRQRNLDELPQFINVLKGDMSVVGPRPHPTPMNLEVKDSIRHYNLRHVVKPGITGWAQVNQLRGDASDPDTLRKRIEFDLWYIENWSIFLDVKIISLSIWLMFKGDSQAY